MATHDIARETWATFFDDFNGRHQGLLVNVFSVTPDRGSARGGGGDDSGGAHAEERGKPFGGVSLGAGGAVEIKVGGAVHAVERPTRVYHKTGPDVLMDSEVDHNEALEITSAGDPPITYLRFFRPKDAAGGDNAVARRQEEPMITVV